ncbi:hypothetical protein DFH08DRAFT_936894 [Mycena albidolilacea]|uniref:DUF7779 domain-containing protein n=1 Tax=Mycena albidolilacea TaxID=1033008 RepID=A0AAD7A179_9AGAR|nr:hypothetical protein DFH08DRAFT_936894 [Mycena albidolilacea]
MSATPQPAHGATVQSQGTSIWPFKSSSQAKIDWLATSLTTARALSAAAEPIPFPYVKSLFATVLSILETVEKVKKNRDNLKELCGSIMGVMEIVHEELSSNKDTSGVKFKTLCEEFHGVLKNILEEVKQLNTEPRRLRDRFQEVLKLNTTADQISAFQSKIQELRSNFMLRAVINLHMTVDRSRNSHNPDSTQITQGIISCPPPSRIFHGRQSILDKMHQFFTQELGKLRIFVLHGLGGTGKTQIALKFIEESLSRFSDIFFIDTSSVETIEAGLKDIAATRGTGTGVDDALQWLASKTDEWLLLFDNADNPGLDLHKFLPRCSHGNILITSRNQGLVVHAGSHSVVSDMEESEAVELLLKSACQDITTGNQEIAGKIVKVLGYLALAIIQAGAFISKSGMLSSYLDLYKENRSRLLAAKPTQSHDDYKWTVYTTWQISFAQLTTTATTLLQLCSFLHNEGMSEELFSRASRYQSDTSPARDGLKEALEFLSPFIGSTGNWDSFSFIEVMNELTAFSLVHLDPATKLFSIHPLVHDWIRDTLKDSISCGHQITTIMGMSVAAIAGEEMEVTSLKLLPHIDSLCKKITQISPAFLTEYGLIYSWASRYEEAMPIQVSALDHYKNVLGDDHETTLDASTNLAVTYHELGQYQEAERLRKLVLEKQSKILGNGHPKTMRAMTYLAWTYHCFGRLREAAELEVAALERQREILGEDAPDTVQTMADLTVTYIELDQMQEAVELGLATLEKRKKISGEDHPLTLHIMSFLGTAYSRLKNFKEAEKLYLVVLQTRMKVLGETHRHTIHVMNNLALTYFASDKWGEAEKLCCEWLAKQRFSQGNDHPHTMDTMVTLARMYYHMNQFIEAENLFRELLDRQTVLLGHDHPHVLYIMDLLARASYSSQNLTEAENLFRDLLDKQTILWGANDTATLNTMHWLALTCYDASNFTGAEKIYHELLDRETMLWGADDPATLKTMDRLALTYYYLGQFIESEKLYVHLSEKFRASLGVDDPDTLLMAENLATIRLAMTAESSNHSA